jgi:gliding motility-associated-like protein
MRMRVSKKPLFKRFAICNMLIIKCDFSRNNGKMTFLDILRIYTLYGDVFASKIFTPNGVGINDIFMPGHELIIFDRLGIELYRGDNGWDGTSKSKLVVPDIYFYKLNYKDNNGITKILT